MEIVETSVFTKEIQKLLSDEEYMELQRELVVNPLAGALMPKGGGLRKLRWKVEGKGKRGGIRVIYYYVISDDHIFMLIAYHKGKQDDLTHTQLTSLRKLVKEELL